MSKKQLTRALSCEYISETKSELIPHKDAKSELNMSTLSLHACHAYSIFLISQLRNNWEMANKQWQSRIRGMAHEVKKRSDNIQYAMLESVQTMLDYLEETFEPVMLPVSKGGFTQLSRSAIEL